MKEIKIMSPVAVAIAAILSTGCATTGNVDTGLQAELEQQKTALDVREQSLEKREKSLASKERQIAEIKVDDASAAQEKKASTLEKHQLTEADLLPPNAAKGECFARVWKSPLYKTKKEDILVKEASETINIIPATYSTGSKKIQVSGATSKLVTTPAVYGTETTRTLVKKEQNVWRKTTSTKSKLVPDDVVAFAIKHATDDIASATPGMCFHEHRKAAQYKKDQEKIMISEASEVVEIVPATYKMVPKTVVVKEASTKIVQVPATYKTETKKILVKPAHTTWKKGSGPIQKIDSATGEIMCLVEVPAEYKTIKIRVIDTPATTKTVAVPEVTKTIQIRTEDVAAKEVRKTVPAKYKTVTKTTKVEGDLVWHEVHDRSMTAASRTGRQICLVNEPAVYKTTTKKVLKTPAITKTVSIPAMYKTIKVKTLVTEASEKRTTTPAVYKTVSSQELVEEGRMEWRSILCDTNVTATRITDIQRSLKKKGFNPGPIDGIVGSQTMKAMNQFQKANNLPVDKYLNVESIRALGVSEK